MPTTKFNAQWGVTTGPAPANGLATNIDDNEEAQSEVLRNEEGAVIGRKVFDIKYDVSFSLHIAVGVTKPAVDSVITFDGKQYKITSIRRLQANNAYTKYAIKAERYKDENISAAAGGK